MRLIRRCDHLVNWLTCWISRVQQIIQNYKRRYFFMVSKVWYSFNKWYSFQLKKGFVFTDITIFTNTILQICSLHSNSRITEVDFPQILGPATISVNGCCSFKVIVWNKTNAYNAFIFLIPINNLLTYIWEWVKVVYKPTFLKDNLVLLSLRLRKNYTNMFPLDLPRMVCLHRLASSRIISLKLAKFTFELS